MSKYEDPTQLDYRYGGDTVDDFAQKYMKTVAYIFSALNELRSPTGGTLTQNPEAYQLKVDDNKLYIRNQANTDWILLGDVQENFGFRTSASDAFMHESDVADSGKAGKLIRADASGKLNADILGNAAKIADKAIQMGLDLADEDRLVYDKDTDTITNRPLQFKVDGDKIYARKDATTGWVLLGDLKQNLGFRSSTDDAFLTESDVADNGTAGKLIRADVNGKLNADILGNARKMAGKTFAPEDLQDGQIPVYRTSDGTWHAENKGTVGTGKNLMIMDGDKLLGEYNGDETKAIDIQKSSLTKALAESTGYGIVSGCEPSISGLTVKVGAGVIHLADGTRKEIAQTNITLDNADPTNPRIDLVYITSAGEVAKITGTASASPSAPAVPTGGVSVCNATIAAGASVGVVTDKRKMLNPCFIYDSVASMVADNVLRVGDVTRTLGYYTANDGGGAIYQIVDTTQFLSEPLNNGLYAELIVEDTLNLKQIGAKSRDSSFNNSPILKSAIDYALSSKKYSTIYIPSGYYTFTTTIDLLSENKSLSVINLVGDGENWNGNASGTVISYYGASNTYLFNFGVVSRCLFKRLLFTGSGNNKCFSIKNCYVTRFEDVQLQDFANAVWLREYCAYVYFDHCMFNCARNGTQGLIINTHYTDGREYTQQYNAEYIYITDCAFDAGDDLSNHVVVYGCHFLWISRCDFCNSADVSILIDTSGWKSNILDVFIDSMSFCRNKIATKIIKGTGQAGRIKINGSWTRTEQPTVDDRILVTEGDGNVYQLELSGRCESYNSATYGVDAINAHMINTIIGEYNGRANDNEQRWYLYAPSKVTPRVYKKVKPSVTVNGNKVTYDFSNYGTTNRFLSVCGGGVIGGTNGQCMLAFEFIHCYGSKITGNTGANISDVTIRGKAITVTCGYNPSTYIGDMSFYALYE